ncbi:hypothetical protein [Ochrobactrum quorumnocens]|uniref:hypothetical protein n=1 Tax=Ochrobactrum quorumnocens TaxID=271865 RepID=UPI000BA8AEEE|nr:hypothetical protein [[Ochrobactrum] quorumnocens]
MLGGPAYHVQHSTITERPEAAVPILDIDHVVVSEEEPPPHRWRLYRDARLDAYVEEALAANTDLCRATEIIRETETARSVAARCSARVVGPISDLAAFFSYSLV